MILDERTEFADATALSTAGAGTTNIGDQVPLSVARNIGSPPRPLYLVIQVVAAVTGATSVAFQLVSDTSSPPLVDGTQTIHWLSKALVPASLLANTVVAVIPLPGEPPAYETILGVQAVIVGTAAAGSVNAFLTHDPKQWKAYPDAII